MLSNMFRVKWSLDTTKKKLLQDIKQKEGEGEEEDLEQHKTSNGIFWKASSGNF